MIDNGNSSSSFEITDKYISTRIQNYNKTENNHHFHCSVKTLFFVALDYIYAKIRIFFLKIRMLYPLEKLK